jgi:quercetin dioxygenase-like cupin family protein
MGRQYHEALEGLMNDQTTVAPVVRRAGEGSKQWFFGGGVWTWKVGSAESGGGLSVVEIALEGGKRTPLHTHPIAESVWVLDGQLRYHIAGDDVDLGVGDFVLVPRDVPHAFLVLSEHARVLSIQPSCDCEAFYLGASEPLEGSARQTDLARLAESAAANGGIEILGPPPF